LKLYFSQYKKKIDEKKSSLIKEEEEEDTLKNHFGFIMFFLNKNNIIKTEKQKQIKIFNIAI